MKKLTNKKKKVSTFKNFFAAVFSFKDLRKKHGSK